MRFERSFSPDADTKGTKRTPSKRTSPPRVPIHRYPSGVWVISIGAPGRNPSCTVHTECPYCEIARDGSSANAVGANNNRMSNARMSEPHRHRKLQQPRRALCHDVVAGGRKVLLVRDVLTRESDRELVAIDIG